MDGSEARSAARCLRDTTPLDTVRAPRPELHRTSAPPEERLDSQRSVLRVLARKSWTASMKMYGRVLHPRRPGDCFINVNVGGFKQRMERDALKRFPQTRLGRLLGCSSDEAVLELCDDFSPSEMEYYFDRSPRFFLYVLNFYLTGKIHLADGLCVVSFSQEIEYWGIKERHLDFCCSSKFHELMKLAEDKCTDQGSGHLQPHSLDSSMEELSSSGDDVDMFEGSWCATVLRNIWIRLEDPGYSTSAKVLLSYNFNGSHRNWMGNVTQQQCKKSWTCLENLQWETSKRHPDEMPEPPQLTHFDTKV